ncbi:hypothetical protein PtB15_8B808 [Puccinia triticina]|nr:hypothetical protein PtB15_8B808 [Puccinia triticina]
MRSGGLHKGTPTNGARLREQDMGELIGITQRREAFNQANREAITKGAEDGSNSEATNSN